LPVPAHEVMNMAAHMIKNVFIITVIVPTKITIF